MLTVFRTSTFLCSEVGGDKAVAPARSPVYFVVYESPKKMTAVESGRGEGPPISGADCRFTTFCKVGSGMTLADYEWIL